MDDDGYPDEDELKKITEWPYTDCLGLLEYARGLWRYPEYWNSDGAVHHVSTGGWSGNESIIGALMENTMFWAFCWLSSERGGHYRFEVPVNQYRKARAEFEAAVTGNK